MLSQNQAAESSEELCLAVTGVFNVLGHCLKKLRCVIFHIILNLLK